jgi:hypothetical protein
MTSSADQLDAAGPSPATEAEHRSHADQLEDYAGGYIQARHGRIPLWLLVVYFVLFVWALYYLYVYWGGLGPGLGF